MDYEFLQIPSKWTTNNELLQLSDLLVFKFNSTQLSKTMAYKNWIEYVSELFPTNF